MAKGFNRLTGDRTGEPPAHPFDPSSFIKRRSRGLPANDNKQPFGLLLQRFTTMLIVALLFGFFAWLGLS
ncbi:MAG TPA: hypothetical protein VM689_02100 [Aliidongia sp.]|nr:hypothetical protein [Aliidongia sp.]